MGFSPPAGGSGGGIAAGWAVSRTEGGMVTGASAMLGHERMAQKIPKEYDFSGHET